MVVGTMTLLMVILIGKRSVAGIRSEERRVGKECL